MMKRVFTKKSIVCIFICICVLSVVAVAISANDTNSLFFKWGELEKQGAVAYSDSTSLAFQGDTIAVSKQELDLLTRRHELQGDDNSADLAKDYLLKREAMYQIALQNGCTVTDQEVADYIDSIKTSFQKAENYDDFQAFLDGADMTIDEYWDSQYEVLKKELVVNQYVQPLQQALWENANIEAGTEEAQQLWQEEYDRIAENYIANDHVVECSGDESTVVS